MFCPEQVIGYCKPSLLRAFLSPPINIYMDVEKLKHKALCKLNMQSHNSPFNKEQIRLVAIKDELTEADIAQLKHFVNRTPKEVAKSIYYGNVIIDPANWDYKLYQKTEKNGWTEHSSTKKK